MSFADELRQQGKQTEELRAQEARAKEEAKEAEKNAKKDFFVNRKAMLSSGEAIDSFYHDFKVKLLEEASKRTSPDSKHFGVEFVYLPVVFSKKEEQYREALKKKKEYYDEYYCKYYHGEEFPDSEKSAKKSLMPLYYETIHPHKIFSEEECDIIEKQLKDRFSKDGLTYSFSRRKESMRTYEEIEMGRWRVFPGEVLGYTLKFEVKWHPWDTSKAISHQCLEKIRIDCHNTVNCNGYPFKVKEPKLITMLGIEATTVYLSVDCSFFHSGKKGYAITSKGFYWATDPYNIKSMSYQEFADVAELHASSILYDVAFAEKDIIGSLLKRIHGYVRSDLL